MNYYIDIQIQPDAEMRENVLLNKVYTKLHKALFTLQANSIGVSFPEYKIKLGRTLRIHGAENRLADLQKLNWLGGLSGYCVNSSITAIPDTALYRTVSRIQCNLSRAKLQRLIKRGSIAEADIKRYQGKMFQQGLDNPYLELESASNGHNHRRYIAFGETVTAPESGQFDHFGLSRTATIPWF